MAGKRSIFEDVGEAADKGGRQVQTGMIDRGGASGARRAIRGWLVALFVLVVVMILVGGLTRLTESGLSITEWALVIGTLPPMGAQDWAVAFAKYQQTPEFRLVNHAMTLDQFKVIYWWEWGHRFLGRIIGLVWIAGFVGFWAAGKIPTGWKARLLVIGVLIGVQGAVGWWMVASGLVGDRTSVASYRLALHLGLAFVILGLIVWAVLELSRPQAEILQARRLREKRLFGLGTGLMHLTLLQIVLGALVAGIDAGRSYTDWPLMAGQIIPPDPFDIEPLWRNFFENPGLVQFIHRVAGYLLIIFALVAFLRARRAASRAVRTGFTVAAGVLLAQMVLGIVTVLNGAQLHVAITHQAGAILAWVVVLVARFRAGYPPAQSVRG
ncbi:heme A synthase [Maritimibacter sp. HL-12]|uniref:heme A synthase n=1 Tax=Maritimibacter sp. HL-12 TaxID=1162418 RepID=UPI000A0F3A9C|nr:heme A synthase [Maritimibacter sp. HL-12]SMH56672.1 cytochrome c oxidase assembly protein subunit 15 [Maritimibacter sp. HL-12]